MRLVARPLLGTDSIKASVRWEPPHDVSRKRELAAIIDQPHAVLAVGRRLRLRKAWQSGVVDAAKLAIDLGGLHFEICESGDGAWIFVSPVEPGPGQELRTASVDPRGHTIAVELDFMQPLRP